MSPLSVSIIVFVCILAGAALGMLLRDTLPGDHLSADAKDVVRLGTGLIGTIAALVLGLLIASAKSSFDTQSLQTKQLTADIIVLDSLLERYGPETRESRDFLRRGIDPLIQRIWHSDINNLARAKPFEASHEAEAFLEKAYQLLPKNDLQRSLKERAIQASTEIAKERLLLFVQAGQTIPIPFLVVLVFWLTIIFGSFSLFAERNAVVVGSLLIFALSASGAIFLVLEMSQPFTGLMRISDEQLRHALAPLGS